MTEQLKGWKTFPLSENLQVFLYGGVRNGVTRGGNARMFGLPEIDDGYYFFMDRHSKSTDASDDSELFDRGSYNFTLLIYDAVQTQLYLIEFDT